MKGHVGGGSTSDGFKASVAWLSNMPFHWILNVGLLFRKRTAVGILCPNTHHVFVQERLPEMPAWLSGFPPAVLSVINLRV